jgi:hypothetical protein
MIKSFVVSMILAASGIQA